MTADRADLADFADFLRRWGTPVDDQAVDDYLNWTAVGAPDSVLEGCTIRRVPATLTDLVALLGQP